MGEAKEIYLNACLRVATALESDGFRWRKSQNDLVKSEADLTLKIGFQSSFRNQILRPTSKTAQFTGQSFGSALFLPLEFRIDEIQKFGSVVFIVRLGVESKSIAKGRAPLKSLLNDGGGIAGTNLGYLAPERQWLEINLANQSMRNARVDATIHLIRDAGLPFFDQFRHVDELVVSLIESANPAMMDFTEIEYAICYGGLEAGRQVLERWLREWPNCVAEYQEALQEYRDNGLPVWWSANLGPRLAKAALALGIEK
jgi:hypothetical protein